MELKLLLKTIVVGLMDNGYRIRGGSDVWVMMERDDKTIKIFLNDYKNPTHIVTRYS